MTAKILLQQRLANQQLIRPTFGSAPELVRWCGAIQAQDYEMSKWAVGMRLPAATTEQIEASISKGELVRTHVLRPTWHLVHPEDIRWMMTLTGPGIEQSMGTYNRKLELDSTVFRKSNKVFEKALRDGKQLTRPELADILEKAKIPTNDLRMNFLLIKAELDMVICNGGKRDKQITYALFEERVPASKLLTKEESLAALALRYFNSHGPATLKDFTGWSGLSITAARQGLNLVKDQLNKETVYDLEYWGPAHASGVKSTDNPVLLIPNYDEYLVAYKDREVIYDGQHDDHLSREGNPLFNNIILIKGQIAGVWRRTIKKKEVVMDLQTFAPLSKTDQAKLDKEVARYKQFIHLQ
ncbi:winged helix DNA-binding domain-containing protein [Chitinophaga filiformis]|uniref:Winged helix DNA-binding domain-containing protein n=1 Tax=Chitinophaga filiformis TaxID=104663 RepID=A0A1G7NBA0_CHIFI|nr:winged helix DNA-binding domain-containing protein [Chitinophaga filiformis]SDF71274.1 Winged helix DNA-binding domain-containing protein [Chitinophaga filiformis]